MRHSRALNVIALLALLAAPATPQSLLTVDDSGGADFTTIADALAAAAPGDRILVLEGDYAAFTLDKQVVLVGEGAGPIPRVTGMVLVTTPAGATVAHLQLQRLHVLGAAGTLLLDNVTVQDAQQSGCPTTLVEASERVAFQGCDLVGAPGSATCHSEGVVVRGSSVLLTDCVVIGGRGANDPLAAQDGRPGVLTEDGAVVDVVHCVVRGGDGGKATQPGGAGGDGGPALRVSAGTQVRVLTHDDHNLYAGLGGTGSVPGADAPFTLDGAGVLLSSGATYVPPTFDPALALTFAAPELAFLRVVYDDEFGPKQVLKLFGVPGEPQVVVGSLVPAAFTVPTLVDGLVWLDPGAAFMLVPVTALGLKVPVNFSFTLPANPLLAGLGAVFQAFSATGGSPAWRATPPSWIVLD